MLRSGSNCSLRLRLGSLFHRDSLLRSRLLANRAVWAGFLRGCGCSGIAFLHPILSGAGQPTVAGIETLRLGHQPERPADNFTLHSGWSAKLKSCASE